MSTGADPQETQRNQQLHSLGREYSASWGPYRSHGAPVGAELFFQVGSQPPPCAVHALLAAASLTSRVLGGKSKILALLTPGALEALGCSRRSASAILLNPVFYLP